MNHATLGLITEKGDIHVTPDVIEPICQGDNNILFGMYYPKKEVPDYSHASVKYDFMITPIPDRMWSKSARLMLHLRHEPGAVNMITDFFKNEEISVVHAELSRSGHRYDTWFIHVVFENLPDELEYDENLELYPETIEKLESVKEKLSKEFNEILFSQKNSFDLNCPVEAFPNSALAYFHNESKQVEENYHEDYHWLHKPFQLKSSDNGVLLTSDSVLSTILEKEEKLDDVSILPSFVFCEFDMKGLNLRLAVIPQQLQKRFFEIGVSYKRLGNPDTCIGVINSVTSAFPKEYNTWRLHNTIKRSTFEREEGSLLFLVEDMIDQDGLTAEDYVKRAEVALKQIKPPSTISITDPLVNQITKRKIRKRIDKKTASLKDHDFDVFLSYAEKDRKSALQIIKVLADKNLKCYNAGEYVNSGELFSDSIKKAIISSREVCVLCTNKSKDSQWVLTEWGAAWGLDKHIVPITLGLDKEQLPDRLGYRHALEFADIDIYAEEVAARKEEAKLVFFEHLYG